MSKHKTFFGKIFGWIGDLFHSANEGFLKAAITVTEAVKNALNSGIVDFLTAIIPGDVDNKLVKILRAKVPVLLADELLIQGITDGSTEEEIQALAAKVVDSFGGLSEAKKEKLYTSLAAQIYIFLKKHQDKHHVTFGEAAALVESGYRSWLESKETAAA